MKTRNALLSFAFALIFTAGCTGEAAPPSGEELAPASAAAVTTKAPTAEAAAPLEVTVEQVAAFIEAGGVTVCDANSESTRSEYGVIPGAKLLTSTAGYDTASVLPGDKASKLVFYCSSTHCSAAEGAAGKAIIAGYTDVNVMRAGIKGWKEAGKPTTTPM